MSVVPADEHGTTLVIFNVAAWMHPQELAHDDGLFRAERIEGEKVGHGALNLEHTGFVNRSIPYGSFTAPIRPAWRRPKCVGHLRDADLSVRTSALTRPGFTFPREVWLE